jgi:hypothetical protein
MNKITAQKRSVCLTVYSSDLLSDQQALNAWLGMFPLEMSHRPSKIVKRPFLCICTAFPTSVSDPLSFNPDPHPDPDTDPDTTSFSFKLFIRFIK